MQRQKKLKGRLFRLRQCITPTVMLVTKSSPKVTWQAFLKHIAPCVTLSKEWNMTLSTTLTKPQANLSVNIQNHKKRSLKQKVTPRKQTKRFMSDQYPQNILETQNERSQVSLEKSSGQNFSIQLCLFCYLKSLFCF